MKMSILVTKWQDNNPPFWRAGEIKETQEEAPLNFCCDDMADQWDKSVFLPCGVTAPCIISEPRHYPEGCFNNWFPIYFCPFCGELIEVELKESLT